MEGRSFEELLAGIAVAAAHVNEVPGVSACVW